jgi:hypothetical protein
MAGLLMFHGLMARACLLCVLKVKMALVEGVNVSSWQRCDLPEASVQGVTHRHMALKVHSFTASSDTSTYIQQYLLCSQLMVFAL